MHSESQKNNSTISISFSPLKLFAFGVLGGILVMAIPFTFVAVRAASDSNGSLAQLAAGAAQPGGSPQPDSVPQPSSGAIENLQNITAADHIFGDPKAPVKIVEFSDTECPFCKRFHPSIQQVVKEYQGKVAWVYRHFPLESLHSKARKEAEATECANELGGDEKFWSYLDRLFQVTPSNDGLDPAQLPLIAEGIGLDRKKFDECLNSGKYSSHVTDNLNDATNSGGQGTPYSIVIASNGKKYELSGAQPYQSIKALIDLALSQK